MDFVWPYYVREAKGRELELSIKSVIKYYEGDVRIFVLGNKKIPIPEGTYIPIPRERHSKYRAFRDVLKRLKYAHSTSMIEKEFIWMMDDIYFINPVSEEDLRITRYDGVFDRNTVRTYPVRNKWRTLCKLTFDEVLDKGNEHVYNYASHLPIFVEKKKLRYLFHDYDFRDNMYLWEILYGNMFPHNKLRNKDFCTRFHKDPDLKRLNHFARTSKMMNHTSSAWGPNIENFLLERLK